MFKMSMYRSTEISMFKYFCPSHLHRGNIGKYCFAFHSSKCVCVCMYSDYAACTVCYNTFYKSKKTDSKWT